MYVRKTSIVSVEISRKRTDDFGTSFCPSQTQCTATAPAVHCNRLCSALHPSLQCTASFPANVCNRSRKRLQPFPQVRATVLASTYV